MLENILNAVIKNPTFGTVAVLAFIAILLGLGWVFKEGLKLIVKSNDVMLKVTDRANDTALKVADSNNAMQSAIGQLSGVLSQQSADAKAREERLLERIGHGHDIGRGLASSVKDVHDDVRRIPAELKAHFNPPNNPVSKPRKPNARA